MHALTITFSPQTKQNYEGLMTQAVQQGLAGTGEHVWLLHTGGWIDTLTSMQVEKDSALAKASTGVGIMSFQRGRTGEPVHDALAERLAVLDNPQDIAYLDSIFPTYEPGFPGYKYETSAFHIPPSFAAASFFDQTVLMGLAVCKAAAESAELGGDPVQIDGEQVFRHILNTTFEGATGRLALDPETGSRLPEFTDGRLTNIMPEPVNETHTTFEARDSNFFSSGVWKEETPFVYNDETTHPPSDLPPFELDKNYIGRTVRAVGLSMAGFVLLLSLAFAIWTALKRDVHIVKAAQPVFLLLLCFGAFIMGATIILIGIDDDIADERTCDLACMAAPWLASVGFTLMFAALSSKTWRVNRLFGRTNMQRVKVSVADVMAPLVILMTINLIVLSVWTAVSPLTWEREDTGHDVFHRVIESRGQCTSDGYLPFVIVLLAVDLVAIAFTTRQSYMARHISTEFAESAHIGIAISSMLLVSSVGIPTVVLVSDDPKARYFVISSVIFVLCSAVLLFIFVPKMYISLKPKSNMMDAVKASIRQSVRHAPSASSRSAWLDVSAAPEQVRDLLEEIARLKRKNDELEARLEEYLYNNVSGSLSLPVADRAEQKDEVAQEPESCPSELETKLGMEQMPGISTVPEEGESAVASRVTTPSQLSETARTSRTSHSSMLHSQEEENT